MALISQRWAFVFFALLMVKATIPCELGKAGGSVDFWLTLTLRVQLNFRKCSFTSRPGQTLGLNFCTPSIQ